jgi:membrane protein DedA with SNARE-associated domain
MSSLVDRLLAVPGWAVLVLVGLVVFAEDALFVGFVLPGETVAVLGGVAAKLGHVPVWAVALVVVVAAIVGDSVGYEVGRHLGPRVLQLPVLQRRSDKLEAAQNFLARRGGSAVFLGRWVAFLRAVIPALAGTARMPYGRFLSFNAAGGLAWGLVVVAVGYAAGASYATIEKTLGRDSAAVVALVVVLTLVAWRVRRHRADRRAAQEDR